MFWRCFWKNIDVDVFEDVLQNAKHRAYDASNDVNRPPLSKRGLWDFTDVTLADEDTKSIPTDNAKRAIKGNVAMHVRQPGGQLWNQC